MSEMNVDLLYPDIIVQVGTERYPMDREGSTYTIRQQLSEDIEVEEIQFYIGDELFDTEERRIALRSGDILHIEYILRCLQENGGSDTELSTAS